MSEFYAVSGAPATGSSASSALIRAEYALISAGFDKLPTMSGNGNKAVVINSAGTALTVTTGTLALAGNLSTTGAYNTVFAQSASTTLTLPGASGTLATLAGTEELTNKTLNASVGKGTWTASGTWTLPAMTLGGAITYGGVTLSNSVTGTGSMVLSTSPALTTPDLGTPSALVGTNITGTAAGLTAGVASAVAGSALTGTSVSLSGGVTQTAFAGATTLLTIGGTGATSVTAIPGTLDASGTTAALTVAGGAYVAKALNVVGISTLTGAVGIGITPSYKLHVKSAAANNNFFALERQADDSILTIGNSASPAKWNIKATYDTTGAYQPIGIFTSDLERVTIAVDGTVTLAGALIGPATATVFNTVSTTVNAFGAASVALNIGHASGTNTISGATTFNQAVMVTGLGTFNGSLLISKATPYLQLSDTSAYSAGTNGTYFYMSGLDSSSAQDNLVTLRAVPQAGRKADFFIQQSYNGGAPIETFRIAGGTSAATSAVTIPGTFGVTGATTLNSASSRAVDGLRIGADSTNNLLDDASTGAGTATLYIGNASINVTSDEHLKSNIRPLEDGLGIVRALLPIEYDQDEERPWGDVQHYVGFGARHSHKIAPWSVNTQGDTGLPWKMRQEFLMGPVVRAMQQIDERLLALESAIKH